MICSFQHFTCLLQIHKDKESAFVFNDFIQMVTYSCLFSIILKSNNTALVKQGKSVIYSNVIYRAGILTFAKYYVSLRRITSGCLLTTE